MTITGTARHMRRPKGDQRTVLKGLLDVVQRFRDFTETAMSIPSGSIPEILEPVGKDSEDQDGCEVRIHVLEQKEGSDRSQTRRITIAGPKAGTARARQVVDSIVRFHHHPSTHPGTCTLRFHCRLRLT